MGAISDLSARWHIGFLMPIVIAPALPVTADDREVVLGYRVKTISGVTAPVVGRPASTHRCKSGHARDRNGVCEAMRLSTWFGLTQLPMGLMSM